MPTTVTVCEVFQLVFEKAREEDAGNTVPSLGSVLTAVTVTPETGMEERWTRKDTSPPASDVTKPLPPMTTTPAVSTLLTVPVTLARRRSLKGVSVDTEALEKMTKG